MVRAWRSYQSDLDRAYPMYALSIEQLTETRSAIDPIDILPDEIILQLLDIKYPCGVPQLTPRKLILWLSDGSQLRMSYPKPFDDNLADRLTANTQVLAWQFVGEKIKYGRLRKILDYVRS